MFLGMFTLIHLLILTFTLILHKYPETVVFKEGDLAAIPFTPDTWYFVRATVLLAIVNLGSFRVLRYLSR